MEIGTRLRRLILGGTFLTAAACISPKPRPFAFGAEGCSHCHMTLADPRFAAQLVLTTGKVLPFDDLGCMASYVVTGGLQGHSVHSLWVSDFLHPETLLPAGEAVFLHSDSLHTPMDYRMVALRPGAGADSLRQRWGGTLFGWDEVIRRMQAPPRA